jgi:hypothetical protein
MTLGSRRRSRGWAACIGGLAFIVAGCGSEQPPPTVTATPSATAGVSPSSSLGPANDLKPMIQGLIDRVGPPPSGFAGTVTDFVVNAPWSDLQSTPNGPITADNAIDRGITAARALGAHVGVKIRLLAGVDDPAWVKSLDGGPVSVFSSADQTSGTIGRFWTADFGLAYNDLWSKLAARYDAIPEVREITVARCMTVFDETFVRDTSDPTSVSNLLAAGFSTEADRSCISQEIAAGAVWRHTRIGVAFNPYQEILPGGAVRTDESFTEAMMQFCRSELGPQCVLENNSIRTPPLVGAYTDLYAAMQVLGGPISFQTAAGPRIGDLEETLAWAAGLGANAVELPQGYGGLAAQALQTYATRLEQNTA